MYFATTRNFTGANKKLQALKEFYIK